MDELISTMVARLVADTTEFSAAMAAARDEMQSVAASAAEMSARFAAASDEIMAAVQETLRMAVAEPQRRPIA